MSSTGPSDIDTRILNRVVMLMSADFATKDVSEHADMLAAHPAMREAKLWHAWVGSALSKERTALGIDETIKGTTRGSRWAQKSSSMKAEAPRLPAAAATRSPQLLASATTSAAVDLGPQYAADNSFTRRMRLHQSWWRATVLKVPCGVGPQRTGKPYGNYLTLEDGARGANFLTPGIFVVAKQRLAQRVGVVDEYRLLHNMLSSQPMCFNLFGPLVTDLRLATDLMRALLPGEVAEVLSVQLEYAPTPASAHLADATAFDAFVVYRQPDGKRAFLGVETKLTESFSQKVYDGEAYRRWMKGSPVWTPEAAGRVADIVHNQLWRDHLLAVAMLRQPGAEWAKGRLALVRHPLDQECAGVAEGYRSLVSGDVDTFRDFTLDRLVDAWISVAGPEQRTWLAAFRARYLDLGASA